jgi:hypothetical protein
MFIAALSQEGPAVDPNCILAHDPAHALTPATDQAHALSNAQKPYSI